MELESEVEEARSTSFTTATSTTTTPSSTTSTSTLPPAQVDPRRMNDMERKLVESREKVSRLEESLTKKEGEMEAMEERYKKYLGKAKSVIKTLDPKHNPALVPDVSHLRTAIQDKERIIENMERETEKSKMVRDMEEKLITTAFYNLGMQMHRQMISHRLSSVDQGHSFMTRQRQASTRRSQMGSNVGNRQAPSSGHYDDMRIS